MAIISLYSFNWLAFIIVMHCVYCEVQSASLCTACDVQEIHASERMYMLDFGPMAVLVTFMGGEVISGDVSFRVL